MKSEVSNLPPPAWPHHSDCEESGCCWWWRSWWLGVGIRSWKLRIAGAAKWINKGGEWSAIGERNIGFIVGDVTLVCFSWTVSTRTQLAPQHRRGNTERKRSSCHTFLLKCPCMWFGHCWALSHVSCCPEITFNLRDCKSSFVTEIPH